MKTWKNTLAAALICTGFSITACGNGSNSNNGLDTAKTDTIVNPPDNTRTPQTDSTLPSGAVGIDTVGGGKSSSSGLKDTSKHK